MADSAFAAFKELLLDSPNIDRDMAVQEVAVAFGDKAKASGYYQAKAWLKKHGGKKRGRPAKSKENVAMTAALKKIVDVHRDTIDSPEEANSPETFNGDLASKYHRRPILCKDGSIDIYRVGLTYGMTSPALSHALKKILMPGRRGPKDYEKDLEEAVSSIKEEIEMAKCGRY